MPERRQSSLNRTRAQPRARKDARARRALLAPATVISRARRQEELLHEALEILDGVARVEWVALFILADGGKKLALAAGRGIPPELRRRIKLQTVAATSPGLAGRCGARRRVLADEKRAGRAKRGASGGAPNRLVEFEVTYSVMALPLLARGRLVGVLELGGGSKSFSVPENLRLLEVLGRHLAGELECRRLEREVGAARDYLEKILASSPDAIMVLNDAGALLFLNSAGELLLAQRRDRVRGRSLASFLRGGEVELTALRKRLGEEGGLSGHETAIVSARRAPIPVSLSLSLLAEGRGYRPSGLLVVARDLRELRQLEDEARRRDQFLANVLTDSADAIIAIDTNDRVLTWNRGAERIFGYRAEEMVGRPFYPIVPQDLRDAGEPESLNALMRRRGMVQGYETRRVARDGRELRVSLTRTPIRDPQGRVIGGSAVVRDITEVKELEQKLIQTERLAAVGMMSTKVAHDVRNPLSSLLLNAELLEDEMMALGAERTAEARSTLRSVQTELDRLTEITEDYLQFARLPKMRFEFCQVNEILTSLLELLDERLGRGRIDTRCELDPRLPEIRGDRGQLRRALLNIMRNAIEAMPHGGMLTIETSVEGREVWISVSDTGVGIQAEELEHIFSAFYSTKDVGTGLGLPVTQQIVDEHGGRISCRSSPGEGTGFQIRLPRDRVPRARPATRNAVSGIEES